MSKYIDSNKLIAEIERLLEKAKNDEEKAFVKKDAAGHLAAVTKTTVCVKIKKLIDSLQQEQPIEGKQVIIITETNGDANIHWDCRSLGDVKALLVSAQSFIADKQVEELRGVGSGPDYNTTEGRFRNAHKFQQERPEVDLEKLVNEEFASHSRTTEYGLEVTYNRSELYRLIKRMALVFNARKEESK